MEYVAGFLFSFDYSKVALINKIKPEWQLGKLNAIGGKVDLNETPMSAMEREFKEETGIGITDWRLFCVLSGKGFDVNFFTSTGDLDLLQSMEEEKVEIFDVNQISSLPIIPNLKWLIPLALDKNNISSYCIENLVY